LGWIFSARHNSFRKREHRQSNVPANECTDSDQR
jgi:hypothetical protein